MRKIQRLLAVFLIACLAVATISGTVFATETSSSSDSSLPSNSDPSGTESVDDSTSVPPPSSNPSTNPDPSDGGEQENPSTSSSPDNNTSSSSSSESENTNQPPPNSSETTQDPSPESTESMLTPPVYEYEPIPEVEASVPSLLSAPSQQTPHDPASENWEELLSQLESGSDSSQEDPIFGNTSDTGDGDGAGTLKSIQGGREDSLWILLTGIGLLLLALGGIGYVVYSQFFSRKNRAGIASDGSVEQAEEWNAGHAAYDTGGYGDDYGEDVLDDYQDGYDGPDAGQAAPSPSQTAGSQNNAQKDTNNQQNKNAGQAGQGVDKNQAYWDSFFQEANESMKRNAGETPDDK